MKALAWDMDGTTVNTEPLWSIATFAMAREMGTPLSPALRATTVGGTMQNTIQVCATNAGLSMNDELMEQWTRWMFTKVGELFEGGIEFRPGMPDLLSDVALAGYPQALVTNTARALTDKALPVIGEQFFTHTVCGDEVAVGKPNPAIYLEACRRLQVEPDEVLAVEDSATGMMAARDAGCRVLGIPCEPGVVVPDNVPTIAELFPGSVNLDRISVGDLVQAHRMIGKRFTQGQSAR